MSTAVPALTRSDKFTWRGHVGICRFDHWVKNVFILPGIVAALALDRIPVRWSLAGETILGLIAAGLVASSNYVMNEILDAPFDQTHPVKKNRPVPSGLVHVPLAYVQWLVLGAAGIALGYFVSALFMWTLVALWIMGCVYNIRPIRSKDVPYLDVLSEAINNPLRLLAGWYIASTTTFPPGSLLLSYWMVGCYFMGLKRYSELLRLLAVGKANEYRKSLAYFKPEGLLVSIMFYAATSMLFFGAFLMRYRMELVLTFPLIAWVMATYLHIAFKADGAAENPEKLYREKGLMTAVTICTAAIVVLLFVNVPQMQSIFAPTAPTQAPSGFSR
jgi:decaprenyl-phosphate phosphoribosyltransferase